MEINDRSFVAKTLAGLEEVLAEELRSINARDICIINRAVSFKGSLETMYQANYLCRTALHILMPVLNFTFEQKEDYYRNIFEYPWEEHFEVGNTIAIDTVMWDSIFTNSLYVSLLSKDAICDRFREKYRRRPSVNTDKPDVRLHVHLRKNECSISLDSSGSSLHKRGYRTGTGLAPLNEVLAAGMILLSGWDKKTDLFDPMCGSATIPVEAAMIAGNIPAGYYRKNYGFQNWPGYDEALWKKICSKASENIVESDVIITGSDYNEKVLEVAHRNLKEARLHKDIHLVRDDFRSFRFPRKKGIIITNPPYGERIQPDDIVSLYRNIGDVLKRYCAGYDAWIISSHFEALKFIGLKPARKLTLYNGPLECRFVKFEVFEGSLKSKKIREHKH